MSIEAVLLVEGILEKLRDDERHGSAENFNKSFVLPLDFTRFSLFLGHNAAEVEHTHTR